jgi:hypothetical protein
MNNETSIKYISSLLDNPGSITEGDQSSIALFRQTFPYFLPARYFIALEQHKKDAFHEKMLSGIQPYLGDWIMFCDFLQAGLTHTQHIPHSEPMVTGKVVDKKMVEVHRSPEPEKEAAPPVQEEVQLSEAAPAIELPPPVTEPVVAVAEPAEEQPVVQHIAILQQAEPTTPVAEPVHQDVVSELISDIHPEDISTASFSAIIAEAMAHDTERTHVAGPEPQSSYESIITEPVAKTELPESEPVVAEAEQPVAAEVHPEPVPAPATEAVTPLVAEVHVPEVAEAEVPPVVAEPLIEEIPVAVAHEIPAPDAAEEQAHTEVVAEEVAAETIYEPAVDPDPLIFPIYTRDYFLQQGEKVPEEIPEIHELKATGDQDDEDKSLMVVMSFSEWLLHFKNSTEKMKEETKDQKALKTMWQKEKLAAAIEEENEEIPENVFEMAVNSIAKEEGLVSEPLAEIYIKQGKYDRAIEMYRKLSLRNPQKSVYFARKIEEALKDKEL